MKQKLEFLRPIQLFQLLSKCTIAYVLASNSNLHRMLHVYTLVLDVPRSPAGAPHFYTFRDEVSRYYLTLRFSV